MLVDVHVEIELLELGGRGVLAGVLVLLLEVVLVLPKIENLADRRGGHGIDLDEVEPALARFRHGFGQSHHAERFVLGVDDDQDFAGANLVIGTDEGFIVEGDNASGSGVQAATHVSTLTASDLRFRRATGERIRAKTWPRSWLVYGCARILVHSGILFHLA